MRVTAAPFAAVTRVPDAKNPTNGLLTGHCFPLT
jgi:hypothetical protein